MLEKHINIYHRGIYNAPLSIETIRLCLDGMDMPDEDENPNLLTTWNLRCLVHKDKISQFTNFEFKRGGRPSRVYPVDEKEYLP